MAAVADTKKKTHSKEKQNTEADKENPIKLQHSSRVQTETATGLNNKL